MKRAAAFLALALLASPVAAAEAPFEEAVALFEDKNYKEALEIAKLHAGKGDARAMAMMGAFSSGLRLPGASAVRVVRRPQASRMRFSRRHRRAGFQVPATISRPIGAAKRPMARSAGARTGPGFCFWHSSPPRW